MKFILQILIFWVISMQVNAQYSRLRELNFQHFKERMYRADPESEKADVYRKHPDYGIIPFRSPASSTCIELLDKRDAYTRYFTETDSDGKKFFLQKSNTAINYADEKGYWREINHRAKPDPEQRGVYSAMQQVSPVVLNLSESYSAITSAGQTLVFNKNLMLFYRDEQGRDSSFGKGDWANYTAGDDGVRITNFYPDIDLVFQFSTGSLETSFILKQRMHFKSGSLVMKQEFSFPEGMRFTDYGNDFREKYIGRDGDSPSFKISRCYAYDNDVSPDRIQLKVFNENNSLSVFTPVQWLMDPSTVYPVVIDPVVTAQDSLLMTSISGTRYSSVCWTNSCDYFLTVPLPAGASLTNIYASFDYYASGACFAQDGGFSISLASCTYPATAPGVITCPFAISGMSCGVLNTSILPDLNTCVPAPQCTSQNLDFTLHFYRCNNDTSSVCGNSCIYAYSPWIMTVEGRTMELIYSSPLQIICDNDSVNVIAVSQYGVEPYQFSWSPSGQISDTIRVSPASTTNYTVAASDACGNTASAISTVQVSTNDNPGFVISPSTVCTGQQADLQGSGAGPLSAYDWLVPGSNAPGGQISNAMSPSVFYSIPGVYPVTLRYNSGTCAFDSTISITVNGPDPATVVLQSLPAGAICPGDTVYFSTTVSNEGTNPVYEWYVDGILVQSGTVNTYASSNFNNGSLVQVILTSNSSCANPLVDTASAFVVLSNPVSPSVAILGDTGICPGSTATFTVTSVNGGSSPQYQWSINGVNIPGAVTDTFTFSLTLNDSIVGVDMISSLSCVLQPDAYDTIHVSFRNPVMPSSIISAFPAGEVCTGDTILFTARSVNAGASPTYQWFINGVAIGPSGPDSVYQLISPANGDSVSLILTSSHDCLAANNVLSWSILTVTAAAMPAVNLFAFPSLSVCDNDTVILTASANAGGSSPVFRWYLNTALYASGDSVLSLTNPSDGDELRVEMISSLSCAIQPEAHDSVVISVSPVGVPSIQITNSGNATCIGDTIQWIASIMNGGNAPTIQWTVNGMIMSNDLSFSYVPLDGDSVQAVLTSNSACAITPFAQSNVFVVDLLPYVSPQVTIHATPFDTICPGEFVQISSQIQNGGNSPQYNWTVNSINTGISTPSFGGSNFQHGEIIQLRLISDAPCLTHPDTVSNFIRILTYPPVQVNLNGIGNVCPKNEILLSAIANGGDGGPYEYSWNHSTLVSDSLTVNPKFSTTYIVFAKDNCSLLGSDTLYLDILPGPGTEFAYNPPDPSSFNNTVYFRDISLNAVSWFWNFGDSATSIEQHPTHTYSSPGVYEVTLISQAANFCTDTMRYTIFVKEDIALFIPTAFTPNGDSRNETWQPIGYDSGKYKFSILDRWGQVIFEGDESIAWDGSMKDKSLTAPEGVYVYHLELMDEKYMEKILTGRVTLIR